MATPQRLPRKFLSYLRDARDNLRLLGQQIRFLIDRIESTDCTCETLQVNLREVESSVYRIALELAELKVTDDCSGCPVAPPSIPAQAHLLVLADELERQALLARHQAQSVLNVENESESLLPFETTLAYHIEDYYTTKNNRPCGRFDKCHLLQESWRTCSRPK